MNQTQSGATYLKSITTLSSDTIIRTTVAYYNKFKQQHGSSPNFGPEGVYEFVSSLFLSLHDDSVSVVSRTMVNFHFRQGVTKVICHPLGQLNLPV